MSETSDSLSQRTLWDSPSAISSPASEASRLDCDGLGGAGQSGPSVSLANRLLWRLRFTEGEPGSKAKTVGSGTNRHGSSNNASLSESSSKTWPEQRRGPEKSRDAWRRLATTFASYERRLEQLVRLIAAGECSGLPTVTARDWRSPGRHDHPRLQASRGEPLTETLGCRLSPEVCEWLMGFPAGWTDASESSVPATPSCPR